MGVNRWCMQCATDPNGRREVAAVGVDEEGEAACYHHATMQSVRDTCDGKHVTKATLESEQALMRERNRKAPTPTCARSERAARTCSFAGCDKPIVEWNRSGRCAKHRGLVGPRDTQRCPAQGAAVVVRPPATEPAPAQQQKPPAGNQVAKAELLALRAKLAGQIEAINRVMEMLG